MSNMKLKNYTSEVPANRSIAKIENLLVQVGAKNINKQYENGSLTSFTFLIDLNGQTSIFKLPSKINSVFKVLMNEVKRPQSNTEETKRKQAERTAWKIVCDWVEIQCAMIQLGQVELAQVFLPYHYNPKLDRTLWERVQEGELKLLGS